MSDQLRQRARASLELAFVGDALAMPVHWYYRAADILRDFPPEGIQGFVAAPEKHPGAIMSLHSTSRGGRASRNSRNEPDIIGEVILKGRRAYWQQSGTHYHRGMPAGENTLNAWCARWLMNDITAHGNYDAQRWLETYIEKMTADPPAHPDTYAESYHRGFFANWMSGKPPVRCAAVTHDTASIGALVTVGPLALSLLPSHSLAETQARCRAHVSFTHPDPLVDTVVGAYVVLLERLLRRPEDTPVDPSWFCEAAAAVPGVRIDSLLEGTNEHAVAQRFSIACYLDGSWPIVCTLAARHVSNPRHALTLNTNFGGDNVHRGWVLGTLLGLVNSAAPTPWFDALHRTVALDREIAEWCRDF